MVRYDTAPRPPGRYDPIEVHGLWHRVAQNPAPKRRKLRMNNYDGLLVTIALVRHPDFDAKNLPIVTSSSIAYEVIERMGEDVVENIVVLCVNSKNQVLGVHEAVRGQVSSVNVTPADVFCAPLVSGSVAFIMVHNHPSGDPAPSKEDTSLTRRMKAAAELVALQMLDHLVIGRSGYYSYADAGML